MQQFFFLPSYFNCPPTLRRIQNSYRICPFYPFAGHHISGIRTSFLKLASVGFFLIGSMSYGIRYSLSSGKYIRFRNLFKIYKRVSPYYTQDLDKTSWPLLPFGPKFWELQGKSKIGTKFTILGLSLLN